MTEDAGTRTGFDASPDVLAILDDAWAELRRVSVGGLRQFHVPDISEEEARRRSSVGSALTSRIAALPQIPPGTQAFAAIAVAGYHARRWASEERNYWTAFECGGWFKSMFAPTGDGLGRTVTSIFQEFDKAQPSGQGDFEAWIEALADLSRVVRQLAERTRGQADRGIFMPKALYPSAVNLVTGMRRQAASLRRPPSLPPTMSAPLDRRMQEVDLAFAAFEAELTGDYTAKCSGRVGISQYPGGADVYSELIFQNTTLSMSPEEIHRSGIEEVADIFEQMQGLSSDAGFGSNVAKYRAALDTDPEWRAGSPSDITRLFQHHIEKMDRVVLDYFHAGDLPRAPHGAEPLPAVLEGTMAYGYYDQPRADRAKGLYLFNATNLMGRSLVDVGAFTYHELVPGHHVHFAGQLENTRLHPLQRHTFCNAFNEGWAEYGRRLAEEAGLYDSSAEVFGGLSNDMRQATRLVVDTGLNVLGWSLEQARTYIARHSLIPLAEVDSLINWYACEIPGQSVSYSLGRREILRFRQVSRDLAGPSFDIRDFHHTVLANGGRPLGAVEADIRAEATR